MTHDPQAGTLPAFPCPAAPYLPHDPPMALIDRVLAFGEDHIQASAVLGTDAGFDDGQSVPSWVLIEYMSQAVAAYAGLQAALAGEPVRKGFLLGTRELSWTRARLPLGQTLRPSGRRLTQGATGLVTFDCEAAIGDERIAAGRLNVYQPADPDAYLAAQ